MGTDDWDEDDDDEDDREKDHRRLILKDFASVDLRYVRRSPRSGGRIEGVTERRAPCDLRDALLEHRRLVFLGHAEGRPAFARLVCAVARCKDEGTAPLCPLVVEVGSMEQRRLDEAELGRLSPLLGSTGARAALLEGRAAVLVDNIDEAAAPDELAESIATLSATYPGSYFFVTGYSIPGRPSPAERTLRTFLRVYPGRAPTEDGPALLRDFTGSALQGRARELSARVEHALSLLAKAPGFGRFSEAGRRRLVASLAQELHLYKLLGLCRTEWAATHRKLLRAQYGLRGGRIVHVGARERRALWPADLAGSLAEELIEKAGLLIEQRPGLFGFVDFELQEYLTAMAWQMLGIVDTSSCADPWYRDVFLYMAAMPRSRHTPVSAATIVRDLLEVNHVRRTLLAERCARAASVLPAALREQVARRVRERFPPVEDHQIDDLAGSGGDLAVPALVDSLAGADAEGRAGVACVLGQLDHWHAPLSVLTRLAEDDETIHDLRPAWLRGMPDRRVLDPKVGFFALTALCNLAVRSRPAERAFERALKRAPLSAVKALGEVLNHRFRFELEGHTGSQETERGRAFTLWRMAAAAISRRATPASDDGDVGDDGEDLLP